MVDCDPSGGPRPRFDPAGNPATQGALDALWNYVLQGGAQGETPALPYVPGPTTSSPATDFTAWLNKNAGTIAMVGGISIGALLLVKAVGR